MVIHPCPRRFPTTRTFSIIPTVWLCTRKITMARYHNINIIPDCAPFPLDLICIRHPPCPRLLHDTVRRMRKLRRRQGLGSIRDTKDISVLHWSVTKEGFQQDRVTVQKELDDCNISHVHQPNVPLKRLWKSYTQYRFGPSPLGNGLDTHRTWEYPSLDSFPLSNPPPYID